MFRLYVVATLLGVAICQAALVHNIKDHDKEVEPDHEQVFFDYQQFEDPRVAALRKTVLQPVQQIVPVLQPHHIDYYEHELPSHDEVHEAEQRLVDDLHKPKKAKKTKKSHDEKEDSVKELHDQNLHRYHGDHLEDEKNKTKVGTAKLHLTLEELWHAWMAVHDRRYSSNNDEVKRFLHFTKTYQLVQEHNERFRQGLETFDIEVNQFADMPHDEFKKKMNGFKPAKRHLLKMAGGLNGHIDNRVTFQRKLDRQLPTHVDWRPVAVTGVKDQGQCGCCWAFSTTGSLEGQYYMKTKKLVSLSEQNLVDCSKKYGNDGCNGGIMDEAFQYIKDNGIETEEDYPFEARDEKCRFDKSKALDAKVTGYVDIPSGDEAALAEAVAFHGPVSVAIDASHESLQYYTEGIYAEPKCGNTTDTLDHAVLLVGYGTDHKTNQAYWLVKNSWSSRWGEKGYVRIARNKENKCGIASMASFPQFKVRADYEMNNKSEDNEMFLF